MTGSTQFYRLTLDRAIADYQDGLITATGLLRYYLKIRYAPGWKIRLNPEEICSLLGFTKATFYKALAKLKKLGRASINKLNLISVSLTETEETDEKQNSSTVDTQSPTVDTQSPTKEKNSPTELTSLQSENLTTSKPPKIKASSDSPNSYSNSYQIFIKSLSNSQRENFLAYGADRANQLPNPPVLVKKWVQNNWEELVSQWKKKSRSVVSLESDNTQKDWRTHPKFEEWLGYVRINWGGFCATDTLDCRDVDGNGEVYHFGTPEDRTERRAFAVWARANSLI